MAAQATTIALALFLVAAVALNADGNGNGTPQDIGRVEPQPSLSPATSPSVSPSPEPEPEPESEEVPSLLGESEKPAVKSLERLGFVVVVKEGFSSEPAGTVIGQLPRGGVLELGETVVLTIARPLPTIPDVVGLKLAEARTLLKDAGFEVAVRKQNSSEPPGTVLSQTPVGGSSAKPGRRVALAIAKAPPSSGDGSCDPSYPGVCIAPYPPDLDCGEIPYTNFQVVASDPHGFDGDNDGVGCET